MRFPGDLGRGLFLHLWADLDTNPTVMGLARHLAAQGFELDICHETRGFLLPPSFRQPGITSFAVAPSWRQDGQELKAFVAARNQEKRYAFVIASDPQGLLAAEAVLPLLSCPLIYLSFEIIFKDELSAPADLQLKEKECQLSRQAALVIIQDQRRGELLAQENGIPIDRFVFLPNAPHGPARPQKNDFLHQRLGIPQDKLIVLHAGSFAPWTYGEELCDQARHWDERFMLVIHTRHRASADVFLQKVASLADPTRVRFSTEPLPYDEYATLVSGCDIGLVLYRPSPGVFTQKNITEIGLSSGKFSWFMRHGKPVIANGLPTYQRLFRDKKIGATVESPSEIGGKLEELAAALPDYGARCCAFFDETLAFERNAPRVVDAISSLL